MQKGSDRLPVTKEYNTRYLNRYCDAGKATSIEVTEMLTRSRAFCKTFASTSICNCSVTTSPPAMHLLATARAELLVIRKIIFNALAWQVCRQRPAAALFTFRFVDGRQARIGQIDDINVTVIDTIFKDNLFSFVEDAINMVSRCVAQNHAAAQAPVLPQA